MKPVYKMLFRRLILAGILFGAFSAAAYAQENQGFMAKIKSFFTKSSPAVSTVVAEPQKTEAAPEEQTKETEQAPADRYAPTFDFSDRTIGDENAPIKMRVFTSLTCGHCSVFHNKSLPEIIKKYVNNGQMQVIFADFPLDDRAMVGSLISRCLSGERYFAFMDTLYANQNKWMMSHNLQEALLPYARLAGMPEQKMLACAQDENALKEIARQRNLYVMKYKINATPTIVLSAGKKSEKIQGVPSLEDLDAAIAKLDVKFQENTQKAPAGAP